MTPRNKKDAPSGAVRLEGLQATQYNGCVGRVLPDNFAEAAKGGGRKDDGRVAVFVYEFQRGLRVRTERLQPAAPTDLVEVLLLAVAKDDLIGTMKRYTRHRNFYEPGGGAVLNSDLGGPLPPINRFLSGEEYRQDRANNGYGHATCIEVNNFFKLILRRGGERLFFFFWFVDIEDWDEDEVAAANEEHARASVRLVRRSQLESLAGGFFSSSSSASPGNGFAMMMVHSEAPAMIARNRTTAGHYFTVFRVDGPGGKRLFRFVQAFGAVFPLQTWLDETDWMDEVEARRAWAQWFDVCASPDAGLALTSARAFFRRDDAFGDFGPRERDMGICIVNFGDEASLERFFASAETILKAMRAVA